MPLRFLLLSSLLLASVSASAQYTAKKIVFKNPGQATSAQLEKASGFHTGLAFSKDDLSAAAQKIADTGFYDNVGATVEGPAAGITVTFVLTPSSPGEFLPTAFENLVWLTPDEITEAIRKKIPVYNGRLAEAGNQADIAADALADALKSKGVGTTQTAIGTFPASFHIDHETAEPTLEHPARVMEFRVVSPLPVIENVKLAGATHDIVPLLQKSVNKVAHTAYNEGKAGFITQEAIVAPLLDAGYAQAILSRMTMEIGSVTDGKVPLVLTTTLTAGPIYKVKAVNFEGAPLYSAEEFAKNSKLHMGDVASRHELLATLAPLDAAYRTKGYMDVIVKADPSYDAGAGTVVYDVTVTPGKPYLLDRINAEGLDATAQADFNKHFLEHKGDPYNPIYVKGFIANNTALQSLAPYSGSYKATAHPGSHTVDLELRFVRATGQSITVR